MWLLKIVLHFKETLLPFNNRCRFSDNKKPTWSFRPQAQFWILALCLWPVQWFWWKGRNTGAAVGIVNSWSLVTSSVVSSALLSWYHESVTVIHGIWLFSNKAKEGVNPTLSISIYDDTKHSQAVTYIRPPSNLTQMTSFVTSLVVSSALLSWYYARVTVIHGI